MQGNRLHGKVAVIIGGASGIGQSITNLFLQHGAKVIVAYEQDNRGDYQPFLESLKKETYHTNVIHVPFDVTSDISELQKAVDQYPNKKLDIMVINASKPNIKDPNNILGTNIEEFTRALNVNVNVHGAFLGAKLAASYMIQAQKGVILFTSGDALLTTEVCPYAYAMSKHALFGLAYNLSAELEKQKNIRIRYISPNTAAGKEKKKAAEGTIGARGNLKEVVVKAADKVAAEALELSSDVGPEDGGSSQIDQPSEKKRHIPTGISAAKLAKYG